jgi:hypothetical protein
MLILFFDIKGLVHKKNHPGRPNSLFHILLVLQQLHESVTPNFGDKELAVTMHRPTLPFSAGNC